jgi:hypothetical protein
LTQHIEIEIGVLRGQCLDRRIGERERLISEVEAWQRQSRLLEGREWNQFQTKRRALPRQLELRTSA